MQFWLFHLKTGSLLTWEDDAGKYDRMTYWEQVSLSITCSSITVALALAICRAQHSAYLQSHNRNQCSKSSLFRAKLSWSQRMETMAFLCFSVFLIFFQVTLSFTRASLPYFFRPFPWCSARWACQEAYDVMYAPS